MPNATVSEKVREFFAKYPLRTFDKRQLLLRAEAPVRHVFYITDGRVSQFDITSSGNEIVVNVFKSGAFFPMSAAMNDIPNAFFFEASTKVTAYAAPVGDAVQFIKDNPDVLFDLLSRVYRGVDGILQRMVRLMSGGAKSRLQFELINAAYRFGESQPDGSVRVPLKENDIAKQSGMARETVNRMMQGFKADKLIDVTREGIIILDVKALESQDAD